MRLISLLATLIVATTIATGCSTYTPREHTEAVRLGYNSVNVAASTLKTAGKLSPATEKKVTDGLAITNDWLTRADTWNVENPVLADTPGFRPAYLDPLQVAIAVASRALAGAALIAPISHTPPKPSVVIFSTTQPQP